MQKTHTLQRLNNYTNTRPPSTPTLPNLCNTHTHTHAHTHYPIIMQTIAPPHCTCSWFYKMQSSHKPIKFCFISFHSSNYPNKKKKTEMWSKHLYSPLKQLTNAWSNTRGTNKGKDFEKYSYRCFKKKGGYKTFLNPRILNTKDYHVHLFRCGKNTVIALEVNIKQWIVISQIQPK